MAQVIAQINARQDPAPMQAAEAGQKSDPKPISVDLHGRLDHKDQRRLLAIVDALNAIEGVTVNLRGSDSNEAVTEATVRDPYGLLTHKNGGTTEDSGIQTAIVQALRAGGVKTIRWEENEPQGE